MAWKQSQALRISPADAYSIGDDFVGMYNYLGRDIARFCFDRSVWIFGSALQSELDTVHSDDKNQKVRAVQEEQQRTRILNKWIPKASDAAEPKAKPATQFRDPAKR